MDSLELCEDCLKSLKRALYKINDVQHKNTVKDVADLLAKAILLLLAICVISFKL